MCLNRGIHATLITRVQAQIHDHQLSQEEVEAIAATHQIHTYSLLKRLLPLILLLPFLASAQGTINVIPVKQFQDSVNHAFNVTCVSGCSASAGFIDNTAFTVGTNSITNLGAYFTSGADPACTTGNACRLRIDASSNLRVNCIVGCAGGSTTPSDTFANPSTAGLQFTLLAGYNGTTWDRLRSSIANGLQVDVTRVQGSVAVTGTFFQATQPVSCASAATCPVNASQVGGPWTQNLTQVAGTSLGATAIVNYGSTPAAVAVPGVNAFITNTIPVTGTFFQGTQPVSLTSTTITGTVAVTQSTSPWVASCTAANCAINVSQVAGTSLGATAVTNFGTAPAAAAVPGVNASLYAGTSPLAVVNTNDLKTDMSSEAGTAITNVPTAIGTKGTGNVISVNSDTTSVAGTATVTAAAGVQKVGVVGNTGAAVDAANNAALPANVVMQGVQTIAQGTQPTAATANNARYTLASTEGVQYVQIGNSNVFSCVVAITVTVTTQCQAAPGAGLRAYVTSVTVTNAVATAQTIDVVFGTGANCATGTTALTAKWAFGTAIGNANQTFLTPLVPTAANAICLRPSAATIFGGTITGFIAP